MKLSKEDGNQRPAKRLKGTGVEKWQWKDEEIEPTYSLYYVDMFFVSREEVTDQLLRFHEQNYIRGSQGGSSWVIPILFNDFGLGKTTFALEYIRRIKQKWNLLDEEGKQANLFLGHLSNCHTICIRFSPGRLLDKNGNLPMEKACKGLIDCISEFFDTTYGKLPRAFDNPEANYETVLRNLTAKVGPLFIVIDEIGLAFYNGLLDDFAKRERFIEFCTLLMPLFAMRNLFFLIAGRASFFERCREYTIAILPLLV